MLVWYVHSPRQEGAHIPTYLGPSLCTPIIFHQWEWTLFLPEGKHPETGVKVDYAMIMVKPVRTPVAILGSLGVCIYVLASRHWLISYSPIHLI